MQLGKTKIAIISLGDAVTKYVKELYANVFGKTYGLQSIGLRYVNVFGPRQDRNGDGEPSRDFCIIANVVQANLLAASTTNPEAVNQVCSVALGERTTLNELYAQLHTNLPLLYRHLQGSQPTGRDFRAGDVQHSLADISKAATLLGYASIKRIGQGLALAMPWHITQEN